MCVCVCVCVCVVHGDIFLFVSVCCNGQIYSDLVYSGYHPCIMHILYFSRHYPPMLAEINLRVCGRHMCVGIILCSCTYLCLCTYVHAYVCVSDVESCV